METFSTLVRFLQADDHCSIYVQKWTKLPGKYQSWHFLIAGNLQ